MARIAMFEALFKWYNIGRSHEITKWKLARSSVFVPGQKQNASSSGNGFGCMQLEIGQENSV
jgi:hypothetical protein